MTIYYKDGYELDSTLGQTIHGMYFPPHFFDTPAARAHWDIKEFPETQIVETFNEVVSEPINLTEIIDETVILTEAPIKPKKAKK